MAELAPSQDSSVSKAFNLILVLVLFSAFFCLVLFSQTYQWDSIWKYRQVFINGWLTTIWLSLASLVLSLAIGLIFSLMRQSRILALRYLARIYIEVVRGTPLLVQLLFFFYVVASALNIQNRYFVGVLTLSIFSGAYIAEILRSGIENTRKTLLESAYSLGLTKGQTYRFVIFPIAFRQILPPLAGQFSSIIKDSSLLSILGISEFTFAAQQVSSATFSTLECYFPLAIGYLLLTFPVSFFSRYLEKRAKHEA